MHKKQNKKQKTNTAIPKEINQKNITESIIKAIIE